MPDPVAFADIAQERGADASKLRENKRHLAAIYMAGYMVECRLKGLLQSTGKKFPTSGREGHNLRALWEAAGFRLTDASGHKRLFLDHWSTDLRYQQGIPENTSFESLYTGAIELAQYIQVRMRNSSRKKS